MIFMGCPISCGLCNLRMIAQPTLFASSYFLYPTTNTL
jgi:hypothetical protein